MIACHSAALRCMRPFAVRCMTPSSRKSTDPLVGTVSCSVMPRDKEERFLLTAYALPMMSGEEMRFYLHCTNEFVLPCLLFPLPTGSELS